MRTAALRFLIGAAFALCIGTGAGAQTTPRTSIVVAPIASTDMSAVYWAKQQGLFDKAGLDVTIQQTPSGAASMQATVGGAAQIGYNNTLALAVAHGKNIPVQLIAPGAQYRTNLPHALLLVASTASIKTPKDVEGKIVAVPGLRDLLGISTVLWLTQHGVDASKVNFVEMPPALMQAALQAKRIDLAATYEPFQSATIQSGVAKIFAKPYDAIGNGFLTGSWFVMTPWANQHHDAVIAFARVLDAATTYIDEHHSDLLPLISTVSNLPIDTLSRMTMTYTPPRLDPSQLQLVIDAATKGGQLATPFAATDLIFPGAP
jgi:NitT/TauT family transport system substrate-binding protein